MIAKEYLVLDYCTDIGKAIKEARHGRMIDGSGRGGGTRVKKLSCGKTFIGNLKTIKRGKTTQAK
jgi:hypothetical protein